MVVVLNHKFIVLISFYEFDSIVLGSIHEGKLVRA